MRGIVDPALRSTSRRLDREAAHGGFPVSVSGARLRVAGCGFPVPDRRFAVPRCAVLLGAAGRDIHGRRMPITKSRIEKNAQRILENVAAACRRAGRSPQEVSIVVVTKSVDVDTIKELLKAGLTDLGENRVQPLIVRAEQVGAYLQRSGTAPGGVRWHMVGHLQRNKVRKVLAVADVIHSVDSLRLAEELSTRADEQDMR